MVAQYSIKSTFSRAPQKSICNDKFTCKYPSMYLLLFKKQFAKHMVKIKLA